jgi:hypothetical protein
MARKLIPKAPIVKRKSYQNGKDGLQGAARHYFSPVLPAWRGEEGA